MLWKDDYAMLQSAMMTPHNHGLASQRRPAELVPDEKEHSYWFPERSEFCDMDVSTAYEMISSCSLQMKTLFSQ